MISLREGRIQGRLCGRLGAAAGQISGTVALMGMLAGAPAGAEAVLLVPVRSEADLASAYDLMITSGARALATGPVAGTLVTTNTSHLRSSGLAAGFLVIGWGRPACGNRS